MRLPVGTKVVRSSTWQWGEQDRDSIYGIVIKDGRGDKWMTVHWIGKDGAFLRDNRYEFTDLSIYEDNSHYTVKRSFLAEALETGIPKWKHVINEILMKNLLSDEVVVSEELIIEALKDKNICPEWKNKIKKEFPTFDMGKIEPAIFKFEENFILTTATCPIMIGKDAVRQELKYKSLLVSEGWEVVTEETGSNTIIYFKKKQ